MTMKVRALLAMLVAVAMMGLASCGHYVCSTTFGASSCTPSGSGIGTTGGNPTANAFAYYVANAAEEGLVLDSTPALTTIPNYNAPVLPGTPVYSASTIAQKKFLYTAIGDTTQLFAWSINTSGALSGMAGSPYTEPFTRGIPLAAQPTTNMITNSAGTFLYFADSTNLVVHVFSIDSTTGLLTELASSPFATGAVAPWNLSMDSMGRFLYLNQGDYYGEGQTMAVFTINSGTGALSGLTTMPIDMWQVVGDSSGKYMIGTRGETGLAPGGVVDQHLYVFSINSSTGVLTQVSTAQTTNGTTGVVAHPTAGYVYDFSLDPASGAYAAMEGFSLNTTTGVLTPLNGSPFTSLTFPYQGFFDQTAGILFAHASGQIVVMNVDASTGLPSESLGPFGGTGNLAWAISDAP